MRFILVDEIIELEPGRRIKAVKCIAPDEDYFQDHFPGFPVVPGVLLTEMMAQAAGKCLDAEVTGRGHAMLARITNASFRDWVPPGQTAILFAEITSSRPTFAAAKCWIEVAGRRVCSAELFFTFLSVDKFAPGFRDEVLQRFLATNRSGARDAEAHDPK